jgi:hypothetical protein
MNLQLAEIAAPLHPSPTLSSWSTRPAGTCRHASSYRPTSPFRVFTEAISGFSASTFRDAGALDGQKLEICWLKDPFDLLAIQIEGSGRVILEDGTPLRVNYDSRAAVARSRSVAEAAATPRDRCTMPPVDAPPVHWSPWQWNWFTGGTPLWLIWHSLKWEVCRFRNRSRCGPRYLRTASADPRMRVTGHIGLHVTASTSEKSPC